MIVILNVFMHLGLGWAQLDKSMGVTPKTKRALLGCVAKTVQWIDCVVHGRPTHGHRAEPHRHFEPRPVCQGVEAMQPHPDRRRGQAREHLRIAMKLGDPSQRSVNDKPKIEVLVHPEIVSKAPSCRSYV